ncbi:MAG: TRAP transporter large permease [Betaproteobacteria bacterium]
MSPIALAAVAFAALMLLLAARVPLAVAMLIVGMVGLGVVAGVPQTLAILKTQMFYQFLNYDLSVIPMFLLMGGFAMHAGFSQSLFRCANAFLGHHRGGIAMATIGACAGFGAVCGSSLATAATMTQVALPELRRHGYSGALASGTLAAGGTLGILIPPSLVLVVCAILLETGIQTLFQAGMLPGLLAAVGYVLAIMVYVRLDPRAGPRGARTAWAARLRALIEIWPVALIFFLVIGGIYFGWFTPTQAASVGAVLTGGWALGRGLRWRGFLDSVLETASATAMIYMILFGAGVLVSFLGFTRLPSQLGATIAELGLPPMLVLLIMLGIFLVLGCVMESLSMIVLLVPIFWPILQAHDFGMPQEDLKVWFSILALVVVEFGMITPPIGLNVFVINALAKDIPMSQTFRGVVPFLISDLLRLAMLVGFPLITLALPQLLRR